MKKPSFYLPFFLMCLCITSSTQALITEFLVELHILSEFNRYNREALYGAVSSMFSNKKDGDQTDLDAGLPAARRVQDNLDRPFTFADLAGDISQDILEVMDFIKEPERFARVGAKMPKGILLYGPPGTGKTSIARAIAGEANAEFFSASGSDFVEMYVGVGPSRVRELFEKARACKKAIIFIDEIDAIGGKRTGETNSEYRNTLNELLKQMDGFARSNITVIAATNRVEDLDEALLRPGRFDRLVKIDLPSTASRRAIFSHYASRVAYAGPYDVFETLAQRSTGFSGADIKNVINEAAVLAARENSSAVTEAHLSRALENALKQKRSLRKNG